MANTLRVTYFCISPLRSTQRMHRMYVCIVYCQRDHRMSLFVGAQNACYDFLRLRATSREHGLGLKPSVELFVGCGISAGLVAQTFIYPLDVIRRRIQMNSESVTISQSKFQRNVLKTTKMYHVVSNRTWLALHNVVKQEGIKSLFAGLTPTYLKVVPSVAISVTVRDILLGRLKPQED